jgi:hypothetical protein
MADDEGYRKANEEKCSNLYKQCLVLYEYLNVNDLTYSFDRHTKIERLKAILAAVIK